MKNAILGFITVFFFTAIFQYSVTAQEDIKIKSGSFEIVVVSVESANKLPAYVVHEAGRCVHEAGRW